MRRNEDRSPDPTAMVRAAAQRLADDRDCAAILAAIGDASLVLLGESTHGTHEFYARRATITQALIEQRGFSAVAIEGDWPDAYRVNRYAQGGGGDPDAAGALAGFARFPSWMWRNTAVVEFVAWLRAHNATIAAPERRVGFYGLDLYSLHASMRAVIAYLERHDPAAARAARRSYACFEEFGPDTDSYAWAASRLGHATCAEAVARELVALRERRAEFLRRDGPEASDEYFFAVQNAQLAKNAERYYRTQFRGRVKSWNIRDEHMAETLEALLAHLRQRGQPAKVVVWAHNSHLGDARATEMGEGGELNLGELVRRRHGAEARLIGQTTYRGTVMAAEDWGEPGRVRAVRPALAGSYEDVFHDAGLGNFFVNLTDAARARSTFDVPRLERAIGVIYRPDTERWSHYFRARLARQFDAVIHCDETRSIEPLESVAAWDKEEALETYPSGV